MTKKLCKIVFIKTYHPSLVKTAEEELGDLLSNGWKIEGCTTESKDDVMVILSLEKKSSPYRG